MKGGVGTSTGMMRGRKHIREFYRKAKIAAELKDRWQDANMGLPVKKIVVIPPKKPDSP